MAVPEFADLLQLGDGIEIPRPPGTTQLGRSVAVLYASHTRPILKHRRFRLNSRSLTAGTPPQQASTGVVCWGACHGQGAAAPPRTISAHVDRTRSTLLRPWVERGILALCLLILMLPVHLRPENYPTDDAWFYLQVAHHLQAGHGSTFNEITRTNGYHPLWLLLCAAAERLSGDKRVALRLVLGLQQLLFLALLFLFHRLTRRLAWTPAIAAWPILAGGFLATAMYGVEAFLNGAVLLCTLLVFLLEQRDSRRAWAGFGFCLGILFLSRLDNVFLVTCLVMAALFAGERRRPRTLAGRILCLGLPFAAVALPYLLLNRWGFGHWVPVSGAIKSRFPVPGLHVETLGAIGALAALGGALSLLVAWQLHAGARRVLLALGSGVVLQAAYMLFFVHDNVLTWAFVPGLVNLALLSCFAAHALMPLVAARIGSLAARGILLAFMLAGLGLAAARAWSDFHNPDARGPDPFQWRSLAASKWQNDIGLWLQRTFPSGTRFFVYQWPGAVAYFSDQPCLPEDGLIGDYAYDEDIVSVGIGTYLRAHGIDLFLGPYPPPVRQGDGWVRATRTAEGWRVAIFGPRSQRAAGCLDLLDAQIVARVDRETGHPTMPHYAVWKLQSSPSPAPQPSIVAR